MNYELRSVLAPLTAEPQARIISPCDLARVYAAAAEIVDFRNPHIPDGRKRYHKTCCTAIQQAAGYDDELIAEALMRFEQMFKPRKTPPGSLWFGECHAAWDATDEFLAEVWENRERRVLALLFMSEAIESLK